MGGTLNRILLTAVLAVVGICGLAACDDDPVSAADSAAVEAAGGRFEYIYTLGRSTAVGLPRANVEMLRAHPTVAQFYDLANVPPTLFN